MTLVGVDLYRDATITRKTRGDLELALAFLQGDERTDVDGWATRHNAACMAILEVMRSWDANDATEVSIP